MFCENKNVQQISDKTSLNNALVVFGVSFKTRSMSLLLVTSCFQVTMRICESEENRRKLAWLVPGYILLAWFFCVVFQPLGLTSVPGHGNNNDYNDESLYEIINLQDDPQVGYNHTGVITG
jgi:hypothetical protein